MRNDLPSVRAVGMDFLDTPCGPSLRLVVALYGEVSCCDGRRELRTLGIAGHRYREQPLILVTNQSFLVS